MDLKQKIKQSSQLLSGQKIDLLAHFDHIPKEKKEKLEYLLDGEQKIRDQYLIDIKTAGKKTVKSFDAFLEKQDG